MPAEIVKLPKSKKTRAKKWEPILAGSCDLTVRAREAVAAIAQDLFTRNFVLSEQLQHRWYGYEEALLYGYLAAGYSDPLWSERAIQRLNQEIDQASGKTGNLHLHSGLSGLGWTAEHLACLFAEGSEEIDETSETADDDLTADINSALIKHLQSRGTDIAYDLVSGLVGFGVYFLERGTNPAAVQGVRLIFDRLESLAESTDRGITWHTPATELYGSQARQFPNGFYNLGVSHGVPGVIHFLSQISGTGIVEQERINRLLDGAVAWLMAQQLPFGAGSRFPCWVAPEQTATDSRL